LFIFYHRLINNVPLVGIISCKIGGGDYCYYCCCYCCCCYCCCSCCCSCCAFACDLFCEDDCDEDLVFNGVEDCGELVGVIDREELEEESEFSKNSIEGFFLLVELGKALVWCFL
jgi:hypothetical protein